MDTLGQRLEHAMQERGIGVQDLVRQKVLSRAGVYQWLNNTVKPEKVRGDTISKLCRALRISRDWLLENKGPMDAPERIDSDEWADVLGYAQAAGLGDGAEAEEYAHTHNLKFRESSLRRKMLVPSSLGVLYGKGESMLPRIKSGDAILFNREQRTPEDEALFVIMAQGVNKSEYSVKRCRQFGDDVYFDSLNPQGDHNWRKPRRMDDKRNPIEIIGRVRWIGSWED